MSTHLESLEKKIGEIAADQAVCREHMAKMCETLTILADLRAETIHILKTQEKTEKEHDEIFQRLRTIETARAGCGAAREGDSVKIAGLEKNQRWVVGVVVGVVLIAIIKHQVGV